jgi:hypothetical protein
LSSSWRCYKYFTWCEKNACPPATYIWRFSNIGILRRVATWLSAQTVSLAMPRLNLVAGFGARASTKLSTPSNMIAWF